jgi:hypothetical protein
MYPITIVLLSGPTIRPRTRYQHPHGPPDPPRQYLSPNPAQQPQTGTHGSPCSDRRTRQPQDQRWVSGEALQSAEREPVAGDTDAAWPTLFARAEEYESFWWMACCEYLGGWWLVVGGWGGPNIDRAAVGREE